MTLKNRTVVTLLALFLSYAATAQRCNPYFAIQEGMKATYEFYNAKNKVVSKTTDHFKDVTGSGENLTATLVMEMIDLKKNTVSGFSESKWRCENGVVHFTMNAMNVEGIDMSNEGMDISVDGDEMEIPSTLTPGESLKDVNYHIVMKVSGITMMDRRFQVKDRKVEAKETITTPAGSYETVKVSYTTESIGKSGSASKPQLTSIWYATDVGVVKMENYKDGKVYSSQLLTKLEK